MTFDFGPLPNKASLKRKTGSLIGRLSVSVNAQLRALLPISQICQGSTTSSSLCWNDNTDGKPARIKLIINLSLLKHVDHRSVL